MAIPKVYRCTDSDAPVLSGTTGSMINLLRKCLVDGYGEKSPAGWSLEFIDAPATTASFRGNPATGTGFFIQVDDTLTTSTTFKGFEIMTSETDGTGEFHSNGYSIHKSGTPSTAARNWTVIATDRSFYLFNYRDTLSTSTPTKTSFLVGIFFGDIEKAVGTDSFACALASTFVAAPGNNQGFLIAYAAGTTPASGYESIRLPRRADGVAGVSQKAMLTGLIHNSYLGYYGVEYTTGSPLILSKPIVAEAGVHSIRGWLPGFYSPYHNKPFEPLTTVTEDGRTFLSFAWRNYSSDPYGGSFLVELGDVWP